MPRANPLPPPDAPGTEAPSDAPRPLAARAAGPLAGHARVPGDKSISHRALMFAGTAVGETAIDGLLEGEDVLATARAMAALGAGVTRCEEAAGPVWRVRGCGVGGLKAPDDVIDLGNSGTGARLLIGLIAGNPITAFLTGDASLRGRPMQRVMTPLAAMGASFVATAGDRLPLAVTGPEEPMAIDYALPVASAQVKSAVLLAGLGAAGATSVIEPTPTRDHTERLLRHFGAEVREATGAEGARTITLVGQPELVAAPVSVPADPSSAAFPAVAALLVPGSRLILDGVMTNPTRTGLYTTLAEMGAELAWDNARDAGGETVADLSVAAGPLTGVEVPAERAPSMIDEYPVLAVAAACAQGTTVMRGLAELRVKESDRLAATATGLAACGVDVETAADALVVHGRGRPPSGGAEIATALDHRIAMAFLVLGLAAERPVAIDDARPIGTSFPGFVKLMRGLGADIGSPAP